MPYIFAITALILGIASGVLAIYCAMINRLLNSAILLALFAINSIVLLYWTSP
jgi:hypothetical protein